jgi:hypothetical protein
MEPATDAEISALLNVGLECSPINSQPSKDEVSSVGRSLWMKRRCVDDWEPGEVMEEMEAVETRQSRHHDNQTFKFSMELDHNQPVTGIVYVRGKLDIPASFTCAVE